MVRVLRLKNSGFVQRTQWEQILKVKSLSLLLKCITDKNDNLKLWKWPPLSHLPRTETMGSYCISTSFPGQIWKIWYEWWMRLQIVDGQGYNVVSIPLLVNLSPSSLCFLSPGTSHRWCCLLEPQSCRPFTCPLLTLWSWKKYNVNTVSLSIMILIVQCEPIQATSSCKLTQINVCIEMIIGF